MVSDTLMPSLHFYQSANADTAIIKDNFVVRTHEYDIIIDDIRNNPMNGSVQHYLLLGRRGSGKSTLLKRLQIEMDTDETLQQTHIAINLAEEQANIYRLYDLLEEIIQELEYRNIEIEKPNWEPDENSFSRKLFDAIHAAIEKSGKKVILLLDNIDRIFENLKEDANLLREMLLNYSDIKIIGGSTRMTEHFWKYNQPFYQFFRVLEMKPLTSNEIKKLLLHWSEKLDLPILKEFVEKRTGQLETIRILTDGLPRTLQFFLNILIKRTHETGYEYLRLLMDQVSPLYQERLNNLPPSQRKIVLQLAFIWEAAGAKEIAEATRMDTKLISAQLKQLIDKGIAERIETKTKNHLYRLSERFFNLWLIFTQGSSVEKDKVIYLTSFLESFYDKKESESQLQEAKSDNNLLVNEPDSSGWYVKNGEVFLILRMFRKGLFQDASEAIISLIKKKKFKSLSKIFIEALIFYQINFISKLFSDGAFGKELSSHLQPIYYTVGILNNEDNMGLKTPPELKETVEAILTQVKNRCLQIDSNL